MCVCISKGTVHVCCLYWSVCVCVCVCVCSTLFVCVCSVASLACVENPVMGQVCVCLCVFLSPCSE